MQVSKGWVLSYFNTRMELAKLFHVCQSNSDEGSEKHGQIFTHETTDDSTQMGHKGKVSGLSPWE